jgi:hypothetical protein
MAIIDTVFIIAAVLAVIGVVGYIMHIRRYNWTVYVKEIVHEGHKKFYTDKARIFYDNDEKSKFLELLNTRDPLIGNKKAILPLPPDGAIYFGSKGQNVCEIYKTQQGVFAYSLDKEKAKMKDEKDLKIVTKYNFAVDKTIVPEIEPFTTEQRIIYARRMEHAYSRKKKTWLDVVEKAAVPMVLGIIVIALLAFYADMGEPLLKMADKVNANEQLQTEQLQIIKNINDKVQSFSATEEEAPASPNKIPPLPNANK